MIIKDFTWFTDRDGHREGRQRSPIIAVEVEIVDVNPMQSNKMVSNTCLEQTFFYRKLFLDDKKCIQESIVVCLHLSPKLKRFGTQISKIPF